MRPGEAVVRNKASIAIPKPPAACSAALLLICGILALSVPQLRAARFRESNVEQYRASIRKTKRAFIVLMIFVSGLQRKTTVRVTGDVSMAGQLYQMTDGSLRCNFPGRLIMIANHQLYTDWLYLWWAAWCNKTDGHIHIVMKESLKQLPLLGRIAELSNFIFLSRNWQKDRETLTTALNKLERPDENMWLLLFPEGTNLSAETRAKSREWAERCGVPDMKHVLLPRHTGLLHCIQQLGSTAKWLYDCTIAYSPVVKGGYACERHNLKSTFLEGKPPAVVDMHWRRFSLASIPTGELAFGRWLNNRWREKDYLLEYHSRNERFPSGHVDARLVDSAYLARDKTSSMICTELKAGDWQEVAKSL